MKRIGLLVWCLSLTALASSATGAVVAESTFDANLEGWVGTEPTQVCWMATDGNPGGYLRFTDCTADLTRVHAPTGSEFLGDLSAYDGIGSISFDQKIFLVPSSTFYLPYEINIASAAGIAQWIDDTPDGPTDWVTITANLDESEWNVLSGTWEGILSNVLSLTISVELCDDFQGVGDVAGIDNVVLTPEPATLSLLAVGLGILARRRRRRIA